MFDLTDKRVMNKGFGDGMSRAFELAATPAVFGGFGHLVDRVADTAPVFTVTLAVLAMIGMFVRVWYGYDAEMRAHESGARWNRGGAPRTDADAAEDAVDLWTTRRGAAARPEAGS